MWLWLVAVVVAVGVAAGVVVWRSAWFRSAQRGFQVLDGFVNLWPNPGVQVGGFHWCRARGRHGAFRPRKLGLHPGKVFPEGTPEYERRMEYIQKGR